MEQLFDLIAYRSNSSNKWDYRNILESLLEVSDLLGRSDFKSELIKELKRHSKILTSLENNPAVDHNRLKKINSEICELSINLNNNSFQLGSKLKNDELVNSFKQRISIPGGTCNFDLPRFHSWLNKTNIKQKQDIESWSDDIPL